MLKDLVVAIQDNSQWAIYADGIEPNSPARYGQRQFENGGLLDDKRFIIDGEMATRALMQYTDGVPSFLDEHGSREDFVQWLKDEGWIE